MTEQWGSRYIIWARDNKNESWIGDLNTYNTIMKHLSGTVSYCLLDITKYYYIRTGSHPVVSVTSLLYTITAFSIVHIVKSGAYHRWQDEQSGYTGLSKALSDRLLTQITPCTLATTHQFSESQSDGIPPFGIRLCLTDQVSRAMDLPARSFLLPL